MAEQSTSNISGSDLSTGLPPTPEPSTVVRPGDVVGTWRAMLAVAWGASFFAYAAVWQASSQIGIATWWTGPRSEPRNLAISLLPFVLSLTIALLVIYNIRRVIRVSAFGAALAAAIAIGDFAQSTGLALAELAIAALLALVTAAAMSGRYRVSGTPLPAPERQVPIEPSAVSWDPPTL